jgi:hypothetical protein
MRPGEWDAVRRRCKRWPVLERTDRPDIPATSDFSQQIRLSLKNGKSYSQLATNRCGRLNTDGP